MNTAKHKEPKQPCLHLTVEKVAQFISSHLQRRKHNHLNASLCFSVRYYKKTITPGWSGTRLWPCYSSYESIWRITAWSTPTDNGTRDTRLQLTKQARIKQRWGCCCHRPRQTWWFLSLIGWTQSKTALSAEKERKQIKSSLMVETGARERTSHTKNQTAAEQRETEELRDVGDELKMSAWLFFCAKAGLLPHSAGMFHPSEHPENTTRDKSHLDIFLNLN